MGGFGSGRQFGRPTVETSLFIDLAWMLRTGLAVPGADLSGSVIWDVRVGLVERVEYAAHMATAGAERLVLICGVGEVRQIVRLCHSRPNYGGRRWWMVCPYRSAPVNRLYLPPGGDRFASRQHYRLGYRSERIAENARALDRLFAFQRTLGCPEGLGEMPLRPKGMWHRTYARRVERYRQLEADALAETIALAGHLLGSVFGNGTPRPEKDQ